MAVGGETKIGSGVNFVNVGIGSTDFLEEEVVGGGGVKSAAILVEDTGSLGFPIARLCLFAQQRCFDVRYGLRLCFSCRCLR